MVTASVPSKPAAAKKAARKPARKSAGRPRADEVEARVDELATIAGQLFLKKGYGNVSLEMIAREARVAVRTIYVKFGGKAGLLGAVLMKKRQQYFADLDMMQDQRPLKVALSDFATRLHDMIMSREAVALQRMLAAEACSNPEFIQTFFELGPNRTRQAIADYLARPDIRAQMREGLPEAELPVFLINCVLGDQMTRMLLNPPDPSPAARAKALAQRLELFYLAVLR
ncbi:TetR/AcrR family transcriptional regulator [Pelomonas sp. KK5]|uniref:TetR/AcrR family transcriptional regulator n=1 Tax=Pelomonas sp. KK5 TaxID=1855730 RepID=UPI00097CBAC4|nr:TetR/AcrR family transcriptional regulator [Pelomonas sp. KK5]